ncbi:Clp protease N-terminal domain-containing protein [Streptantibioticus silvisoli]|uniref:Clp protease N-terminal domain-containing protein n=1 Tax=Streptantibioticus silvisoli TaxID=2705255 RepID=A0ABT6VVY5_9ACTN|nr:Clp protease N-terminal domain-containing protein [Streptantibioticus silvisoli]MDI5962651.1 Clp protease N-terminal domain-containing protein [Streptantibioticus silvisoli]
MRSDIRPQATSREHGRGGRPAAASWAGPELRAVIAGARRRAHRDAERQIDTAHLLHALLECDAGAREALGRAANGAAAADPALRVARVLAYLAQRSIGYGLRWRSTVEGAADRPPAAGSTGYSPCALIALTDAVGRAAARGAGRIEGVDLLGALAADPDARAAEVLRAAGVDPARLAPPAADVAEG